MRVTKWSLGSFGLCVLVGNAAGGAIFTDTFDSIDPNWITDRYEPAMFESIADPTLRNEGNVLRLGVDDADSEANRPGAFSSTFYNTQGRQMNMAPGVGPNWSVSADVFIDASWDPANGNSRRTGLWTRDSNPVENDSNYPIMSFLSQDNDFSLRAWDSLVGWHDLGLSSFNGFDTWNTMTIEATGSSFDYYLNGTFLWSDLTASTPGNEDLSRFFLQAYNFGDGGYEVYWDNVSVTPTPGTLSLLGIGVLACGRRRR